MSETFKYFAFISYNSKDTAWGKKLQKKLEHYKMPATLCSEHNWQRTPIKPVFFAPTDIQPGGLSEELQERLKASQNLIVICSPNSAKSKWVGREIEFFHNLGRTKNIHFFIVDGIPHSGDPETECFNPVIDKLGMPEILGANIHEKNSKLPWLNRERAYVQLVSKLLGVEFDAIWKRHKRQLRRKIIGLTVAAIAVITALIIVWRTNQPFNATVKLNETTVHNEALPPLKDAAVTLTLKNETKTDTVRVLDSPITFNNIPHRFLNKEVHVTASCRDFLDVDTTVVLTKDNVINIQRDPKVYGDVHFKLWSLNKEESINNTTIEVDGNPVTSDANGNLSLFIPLHLQKNDYPIKAPFTLLTDTIHMPCGDDDVILAE